MALTTGQVLQHRYRVVALLGQGGMGAVYRAWDLRLKKPIALKEMVPQPGLDAETLGRVRTQFEQEAVVLARLAHPHLVPVTDTFEEHGNDYLVMAFVEGENLADLIRREGALPETRVLTWARQLLDALAYCHDQGVLHRDIKPQNVVITPEGRAVLVDFGLVKLWDPSDPQTRTVMRGMGTPEYAPPEQWGTTGYHTDPRSDLYSLGATLYHALTGQAPPTASDRMVYPKQFRTPRELADGVSPAVDRVISKAMLLPIDERWPDARAMAQNLPLVEGVAPDRPSDGGPIPAKTERMPDEQMPSVAPARRGCAPRWVWLLGGVTLVVIACVTLLLIWSALSERAAHLDPAGPTATSPATAPATGTVQATEDDGRLRIDTDGLARLDSYRVVDTWHSLSETDGYEESTVTTQAVTRDPVAEHLTMVVDGRVTEQVRIGDHVWLEYGGQWVMMHASKYDGAEIEALFTEYQVGSEAWVSQLGQGDYAYVGREALNGLQTRHFAVERVTNWDALLGEDFGPDEDDPAQRGAADVWIVDEADLPALLVRLVLTMSLELDGDSMAWTIQRDVADINQFIPIDPPEGRALGSLPEGVLLDPEGVIMVSQAESTYLLTDGATIEEVHAFYAEALAAAGWDPVGEPLVQADTIATSWTLDERPLSLLVAPDEETEAIAVVLMYASLFE